MGLVWVTFFPQPLEKTFSSTYNGVRFFGALYRMRDIFFSAAFFPKYFLARFLFPSKSGLQDSIFS